MLDSVNCFSCNVKRLVIFPLQNLIWHQKREHRSFECRFCKKTFLEIRELNLHLNDCDTRNRSIANNQSKLKSNCEIAKLETSHQHSSLARQNIAVTANKLLRNQLKAREKLLNMPCYNCDKKFTTVGALTNHHRSCLIKLPLFCTDCGKKFDKDENLKGTPQLRLHNHKRVDCGRKDKSELKYFCDGCNEGFPCKRKLSAHKSNCPKIIYKCSNCSLQFASSQHLGRHVSWNCLPDPMISLISPKNIFKMNRNTENSTNKTEVEIETCTRKYRHKHTGFKAHLINCVYQSQV